MPPQIAMLLSACQDPWRCPDRGATGRWRKWGAGSAGSLTSRRKSVGKRPSSRCGWLTYLPTNLPSLPGGVLTPDAVAVAGMPIRQLPGASRGSTVRSPNFKLNWYPFIYHRHLEWIASRLGCRWNPVMKSYTKSISIPGLFCGFAIDLPCSSTVLPCPPSPLASQQRNSQSCASSRSSRSELSPRCDEGLTNLLGCPSQIPSIIIEYACPQYLQRNLGNPTLPTAVNTSIALFGSVSSLG